MIREFDRVNTLLSFYKELLTPRQQEMLQYYYFEDLSLSEIAENLGISRNGVYDAINKAVRILEDYEEKLHLCRDYQKRMEHYQQLREIDNERVNEIVDMLIAEEEEI